jgi:hypothetical protein
MTNNFVIKWRRYFSPKRWYLPTRPHVVTIQNTNIDKFENWAYSFKKHVFHSRFKYGRAFHSQTAASGIKDAWQLLSSSATVTKACCSFTDVYINTIGERIPSASLSTCDCEHGPGPAECSRCQLGIVWDNVDHRVMNPETCSSQMSLLHK